MKIGIGIIGVGTVGSGVVEILLARTEALSREAGVEISLVHMAALDPALLAPYARPGIRTTARALDVVEDPEVSIVVETAGGYDVPVPWVRRALELGKTVVTANKAMLAKHGAELFQLAAKNGAEIRFEAAVGGAIPVIRTLREGYVGGEISSLACIINGTANFILTSMATRGMDFADALAEAQRLGYAEADPTFDVEGMDSAHKVALLASLCGRRRVSYDDMRVEGITRITASDIQAAKDLGCSIRLLGLVELNGHGVDARVQPCLVPYRHPLAAVNGAFNAVFIDHSTAGPQLLFGKGAGKLPTASAVVADIVDAARQRAFSTPRADLAWFGDGDAELRPLEEAESRFYLRITCQDKPGVLAKVTSILGEEGVSVRAMIQHEHTGDSPAGMIFHTHVAREAAVRKAVERIDARSEIVQPTVVLRLYDRGFEEQ